MLTLAGRQASEQSSRDCLVEIGRAGVMHNQWRRKSRRSVEGTTCKSRYDGMRLRLVRLAVESAISQELRAISRYVYKSESG